MKRTKFFGLAVLFLIVSFAPIYATELHVPDPYLTIQAAVNAAGSGDQIIVHYNDGAPYVENVVVDRPNVTITRYEGEPSEPRPICQGLSVGKPSSRNAFTISASGVTLMGLNITYAPNNCVRIEPTASGAVVENCRIYGWEGFLNNEEAIGGIRVLANGVTVKNCTIDGGAGWTKNVRFEGVAVRKVTDFTFTGNTVENVTYVPSYWPNGGLRFASLDGTLGGTFIVAGNTFDNNQFAVSCDNDGRPSSFTIRMSDNDVTMQDAPQPPGGLVLYEFPADSQITAVIERNRIRPVNPDAVNTIGILVGEIGAGNDITIKNNFIYATNSGITSYWVGASSEDVGADDIKVYNNTFYDCTARAVDLESKYDTSTGWDVRNNIVYSNVSGACGIWVPSGAEVGFASNYNDLYVPSGNVGYWVGTLCNTLDNWRSVSGRDLNSIALEPLLTESMPHIDQSCACVDAGETIPSVTDDIDGDTRLGNIYDIGADEAKWTQDIAPPNITSGPSSINVTSNSATIIWETDEVSDSMAEYGTSISYGSSEFDSALVASHTIILTGLAASTTYHYRVTSTDVAGNAVSSADSTFTTTGAPANVMHVSAISMSLDIKPAGKNTFVYAIAQVTVLNANNDPVGGATIEGHWLVSGGSAYADSGVTDNDDGIASLDSEPVKYQSGTVTFTFTVDNLAQEGWDYDETANFSYPDPPSGSISYPQDGTPLGAMCANSLKNAYPSPCNPDIWVPFTLSDAEHVVIRIHSLTGRLIRTLDLGNKPAGAYTTKEEAAYWDGKNEAGEYISSGVYFYTIQAGDFTATKKMLIAK